MDPPMHFTAEAADLWRAIVATKPADWWKDDTTPLLEAYCRAILEYRQVSVMVDGMPPRKLKSDEGFKRWKELLSIQDDLANRMASLATKMRLSQQSKYGARAAESADRKSGRGRLPWESESHG